MDNEKSEITSLLGHNYGTLHSVPNCLDSIQKIETSTATLIFICLTNFSQKESFEFQNTCATECQTKWCHTFCETLNDTMDFSVDPCEDFYQHVCGNWQHKFSYLGIQLENVFDITRFALKEKQTGNSKALQYMADLYEDCIDFPKRNQLGREPIRAILNQVLGDDWSFLGNANSRSLTFGDKVETDKSSSFVQFDEHWKMWKSRPKLKSIQDENDRPDVKQWMDCYVEASLIKVPFLIKELTISEKDDGGGRVGIVLHKALDHSKEMQNLNYYFRTLVRKVSIFLDIEHWTSNNAITHAIFEVIEFQLKLVNIYQQPLDLTKPFFENIQMRDLNSFTHFNWTRLLNKFSSKIGSSVRVTDEDRASMFTDHFVLMKPLSELISTTSIRVLKNFMALSIIDSVKLLFDNGSKIERQDFRLLWRKFYATNMKSLLPLYTRLTVDYLGRDKMQMAREQVSEIIDDMKKTFAESIKQTYTWLDGETEMKALNKMDQLKTMISHPDWIFNDDILDEELGFDESESKYSLKSIKGNFVASYFNLIRIIESSRYRKKIKDDQLRKEEREFDFAYNSVGEYIPLFNELRIDTVLLSEPSFNVDHPIEHNFGMVGTIIAHEFLHQFGSNTRYIDKDGKMADWLTNSDVQKLVNRSQCFVRQYNQLVDPDNGNKINGLRTLEENIVDNGGVRLAYRVLEKHLNHLDSSKRNSTLPTLPPFLAQFTHEQLFFLSFGLFSCSNIEYPSKLHSPHKFRVNIPLSNFDKFAQAFNCPLGSKMNPKDKCELW